VAVEPVCRGTYRNLSWPAITPSEQKAAVRQLKAQGRREIDETIIFATTLRQRELGTDGASTAILSW
jgi:hypothetical protein